MGPGGRLGEYFRLQRCHNIVADTMMITVIIIVTGMGREKGGLSYFINKNSRYSYRSCDKEGRLD